MLFVCLALGAAPRNRFGGDREAHANATEAAVLEPPNVNAAFASLVPGSRVAAQINHRFSKRPKALSEAVILHQWDGWEPPASPWSMCAAGEVSMDTVCGQVGQIELRRERISCSIIHAGLHRRVATEDVPLFSYEGGVLLRPSKNKVSCLYGADAGTDYADGGGATSGSCHPAGLDPEDHAMCVPGCGKPPQWCDAKDSVSDNCRCGFDWCSGRPRPWKPEDLGALLEAQEEHGEPYGGLGSLNGYNEVIVDANYRDLQLPDSVEAFFYVDGCEGQMMLGRACSGRPEQKKIHEAFLRKFKLTAEQVPLLRLNPKSWRTPFEADDA